MNENPSYIDIHAHLNFSAYDDDREAVIKRALDQGVWMINVGTKLSTSKQAVAISEQYDRGVYSIVGLHPVHTTTSYHDQDELGPEAPGFRSQGEAVDREALAELAQHPKVVGIGETGLDYFRSNRESSRVQREALVSQIELAIQHHLPLMLHVRPSEGSTDAYDDVYDILSAYRAEFPRDLMANLHFFAGTVGVAQKFLDLGCTISFTGVITFASMYADLVRYVPADRIMAETDCPYVSPAPHRGQRNEPAYVIQVAHTMAKLRGVAEAELNEQLTSNARGFFDI